MVIVGGGAVGSTLARFLVKQGQHSVTLIDANRFSKDPASHPGFDARVIALAKRSEQALSGLGIDLKKAYATPIQHILVSDQGFVGQTRLHAADYGLDSFGQVVGINALGQQLFPADCAGLDVLEGVTVKAVAQHVNSISLTLDNDQTLSARLLVIADGGRSGLAEMLNFERSSDDYGQSALIANVALSEAHNGWAHERFTANGPLALLPFADGEFTEYANCYSLVWTLSHEEARAALEWSDSEFITRLQAETGYRHGVINTVGKRYTYPLVLNQINAFTQHRAVVVGNAAQSLHPIAGQGFNLGLRDVLDLAETLADAADPGSFGVLNEYRLKREQDKSITIGLTDGLVRLFSNRLPPLVAGRNAGLLAMEFCAGLSRRFVRQTMGFAE
ncbi:hypothetical protein BFC17_20610 [Alteromonas lipolytica]|uniref:FAD-binding domain-containing protein n=1 Tax=Alteromonas lipolytica TaxID=1856405 RepID=A0A1E8FEC8_9ALTE|nr:hypothetical protein BFC17_20610 [Alteromonas lipolytica]